MTEEKLIEIAKYYLDKKVSIEALSHVFKISKTSLVRYFNCERQIKLPSDLQKQVNELKRQNWIEGKSTSGNEGNKKLTNEQIIYLANIFSTGDYTLRELSDPFEVSPTTLYNSFIPEILGDDLYSKVKSVYEQNKENKTRK